MNRKLWAALAAVLALSMWLGQGDDDLLAPSHDQARQRHAQPDARDGRDGHSGPRDRTASREASATPRDAAAEAQFLAQAQRWQRERGAASQPASSGNAVSFASAWGSAMPPPPAARATNVAVANLPPPPPPPPPMAPPFPHAWVGRFNDVQPGLGEVARAVLSGPQQTWVVQAGDVIEGLWRVDRIDARSMGLTYLPLKQQLTVVMK